MRFKSSMTDGFQVFAVVGTNTVSFGINASKAARVGLLGFAVERLDLKKTKPEYLKGFKVFPWFKLPSGEKTPGEDIRVSTFDHPVQSLVWDDFTLEPESEYTY